MIKYLLCDSHRSLIFTVNDVNYILRCSETDYNRIYLFLYLNNLYEKCTWENVVKKKTVIKGGEQKIWFLNALLRSMVGLFFSRMQQDGNNFQWMLIGQSCFFFLFFTLPDSEHGRQLSLSLFMCKNMGTIDNGTFYIWIYNLLKSYNNILCIDEWTNIFATLALLT